MAEGITPGATSILPVRVGVSDVTDPSANPQASAQVARAMDVALDKALHLPGSPDDPELGANIFLPSTQPNKSIVGSASLDNQAGGRDKIDIALDRVSDRMLALNLELTSFKVAWSIAKRTGRDVETLLKAQ